MCKDDMVLLDAVLSFKLLDTTACLDGRDMVLLDAVLSFQLLDTVCLDGREKQLALTACT